MRVTAPSHSSSEETGKTTVLVFFAYLAVCHCKRSCRGAFRTVSIATSYYDSTYTVHPFEVFLPENQKYREAVFSIYGYLSKSLIPRFFTMIFDMFSFENNQIWRHINWTYCNLRSKFKASFEKNETL